MKKNISKAKAFQIVVDNMRALCYEQTIEHRTSLSRVAGLIGLCELILIIIVIAVSVSGWDLYGIILISMIAGSFVTNMLWFYLMRREVRIWKGR
ncbi:hypothetical protein DRQ25_11335 [Candidatus Fermentibacteria bacterium]|nr:MAG: hypothetical protein DRQ25_11335 [Candidatus Fermentibacteria bacterium]